MQLFNLKPSILSFISPPNSPPYINIKKVRVYLSLSLPTVSGTATTASARVEEGQSVSQCRSEKTGSLSLSPPKWDRGDVFFFPCCGGIVRSIYYRNYQYSRRGIKIINRQSNKKTENDFKRNDRSLGSPDEHFFFRWLRRRILEGSTTS